MHHELSAILESMETGSLNIVGGDLNGDLRKVVAQGNRRRANDQGRILNDFVVKYNLVVSNLMGISSGPTNTFYGPQGRSCLDYILFPESLKDCVTTSLVLSEDPLNTSDHLPVCVVFDTKTLPVMNCEITPKGRVRWSKLKPDIVREKYTKPVDESCARILQEFRDQVPTSESIDLVIDCITALMKKFEESLPVTRFRKHQKPFWNDELSVLKKFKIKCFREWVSAGRPRDRNDITWIRNNEAKKNFARKLRELSKLYESEKIQEAIRTSELNINKFWKMLRKEREGAKVKVAAIKNSQDKVVHGIEEILETWRVHFSKLSTPKVSDRYDDRHFQRVTKDVKEYLALSDSDTFSQAPFSLEEIKKGISKLNSNKTPGHDGITKENLIAAGPNMVEILRLVFNNILSLEYVPTNFRLGIQVPLYKGKNTSTLDTNNYRGITLLSTYNKLFEVLLWGRMSTWWSETDVVSRLQGACRRGYSCLHTALLLQESIASLLENNSKVFVLYLDVKKAFDSIWIDGLFHRLYALGVTGRTWRILYKSYVDFKSRVRVGDRVSEWYSMTCGIHQGGYLSLIKYTAFIDSLIRNLEDSGACATIYGINISPLGYADDIASASVSKRKVDRTLEIADQHSREWRYEFNAKKSAILVYGESEAERKVGTKYRQYKLGNEKVKELVEYDHVGLKNCTGNDFSNRTIEKIKKGRKTLNAASGIGLKRGGLSMKACSFIFWSLIIPITTFASELWVLKDKDVQLLEDFERYAGRRMQRFPSCSPNETSFAGLGWMRLENFIAAKKLIFIRTIVKMDDNSPCKKLLRHRSLLFSNDIENGLLNIFESPIFNILKYAMCFGLMREVMGAILGTAVYTKKQWSNLIWDKAWRIEDQDWEFRADFFKYTLRIEKVVGSVNYLIWWQISDKYPGLVKICEIMAKLVCSASNLKCDDYRFKHGSANNQICDRCDLYEVENLPHVLLHCPANELEMTKLQSDLYAICPLLFHRDPDILNVILGKNVPTIDFDTMVEVWICAGKTISKIYWEVLNSRTGIG